MTARPLSELVEQGWSAALQPVADQVAQAEVPALSPEEIEAEIDTARAARRAQASGA